MLGADQRGEKEGQIIDRTELDPTEMDTAANRAAEDGGGVEALGLREEACEADVDDLRWTKAPSR